MVVTGNPAKQVLFFLISNQYSMQISSMNTQTSRLKSKTSSSSSGSLKLIPEGELERYGMAATHSRDLFDLLLIDLQRPAAQEEVLRTVSELNLSPRQQQGAGCKCSKIDCLKMYCECFSKGRMCNERCECSSCCNTPHHQLHIYKAQQMANHRHPGTFKGVPAFVPERKCTCKKSACRKNYCECFRAGIKCSEECECLPCQNGKPHHHSFLDSRMQIEVNA